MLTYDSVEFDPPAPVATVILRASDGTTVSDVRLSIDTGADTTLIPRHAVSRLGIVPDPRHQVELIGFDGHRTATQAVDLEMLWLRKAFRGRYLLTESDRGILGRDVLTSVVLRFDGPNAEWSQIDSPR